MDHNVITRITAANPVAPVLLPCSGMNPIVLLPFVAPAAGVIALVLLLAATIRAVSALTPDAAEKPAE